VWVRARACVSFVFIFLYLYICLCLAEKCLLALDWRFYLIWYLPRPRRERNCGTDQERERENYWQSVSVIIISSSIHQCALSETASSASRRWWALAERWRALGSTLAAFWSDGRRWRVMKSASRRRHEPSTHWHFALRRRTSGSSPRNILALGIFRAAHAISHLGAQTLALTSSSSDAESCMNALSRTHAQMYTGR